MVASSEASDALWRTRDDEPAHAEADHDERVQDDERAPGGGDALAAPAIERVRVPDDGRHAQDAGARPAADRQTGARGERALGEVEEEDERAGPPAQQPVHVRRAGVARALPQDVTPVGTRDQLRAGERPQQPGHGDEDCDGNHARSFCTKGEDDSAATAGSVESTHRDGDDSAATGGSGAWSRPIERETTAQRRRGVGHHRTGNRATQSE